MTRTDEYGIIQHSNAGNDKGACVHHDGTVIFGFWMRDGSFMVTPSKAGRSYKTSKGQQRAINSWMGC